MAAIPAPKLVGEAVLKSFDKLLERDLSTGSVQAAYAMLNDCVHAVDPQLSLHVFGSAVVYGFHDPANDVDFVVLRPEDRQNTRTQDEPDMCSPPSSSAPAPRERARAAAPTSARTGAPSADATTQLAKNLQLDCLGRLEAALQKRPDRIWDVKLVRRARVPVLRATRQRFLDGTASDSAASQPRVDFDVTAHRRNGVRNSCLLHHYYIQAPQARWLGLAVKRWSKQVGLNGLAAATEAAASVASTRAVSGSHGPANAAATTSASSSGTATAAALMTGCLTSYAFNLMVVYYLLQRGLVQFVDPDQFLDVSQTPVLPAYVPLQPPRSAAELGELILDFTHFYRSEFKSEKEVVSLSRPSKTTPQQLGWTRQAEERGRVRGEKLNYRLCIEDPYEVNLNVGRFVTPFKHMLLLKHLEKAEQTGLLFVP